MPFEELVNVAMQIESEIDYLHIREREKSTKELYEGVESLLMEGFPASKIVINHRIDIAILLNIPRVQLGISKYRCKVSERKVFVFACRLFCAFAR